MYLVIAEKTKCIKSNRRSDWSTGTRRRIFTRIRLYGQLVFRTSGRICFTLDVYDEKFSQWRYEDLPIIPKDWKVTVSEDKKDQFYILKRLLNSPEIEYVVNACDAGREGELIFKHVYDLSGSKKPVKRLWISSLEDSAILDGMQHLRSAGEYRHLAEAAVCRSQADWLVGMNATRAYTTKYFKKS